MKSQKHKLTCVVVQLLSFEGLGALEQILLQKKYVIIYKRIGVDEFSTGEIFQSDLLVLLGSPLSVNNVHDYPWLSTLINSIEKRLVKKKPTLGICFGAQLIAFTMGARVFSNKKKEIGWGLLKLSTKGEKSCLSELVNKRVLHWHSETFDLPVGARLLASSEITTNQAFSIENFVLALQFHCEVSGYEIEPWLIGHHHELKTLNLDISKLRETSQRIGSETCISSKKTFLKWTDSF